MDFLFTYANTIMEGFASLILILLILILGGKAAVMWFQNLGRKMKEDKTCQMVRDEHAELLTERYEGEGHG